MIAATFKRALRARSAAVLATLLIALLAAGGAQAAKKKKKEQSLVAGTVMNPAGETLSDVVVKVRSAASSDFSDEVTTDKKGEFSIDIPAAGEYVLRLEKEGYTPFEISLFLEGGDRKSVQVNMIDAMTSRRNEAIQAYHAGAKAYEGRDMATAKRQFVAAIETDPSLAEPHLVLADIYLGEGSFEEAAAAAERFLALKPGDQKGQLAVYEAYQKLGDQTKVDELRDILGEDSELARKLAIEVFNEGALAYQKGDSESAIEKFRGALELDPDLAEAYAGLATVFYRLERYDEALASVDELLSREGDHRQGLRVRFLIHAARDDRAATDEAIESYAEVDPEGAAGLLYERADLDFRRGATHLARAALLKALELDPDLARAHYTLGLIYSSTDQAKAKQHFRKFIEMAPDDPEAASAKEMLNSL